MLLGFSPPLPGRRAEHFTDLSLSEEAILCNGLHVLSVAFNKEALLVSDPFSGSAETTLLPVRTSFVLPSPLPTSSPVHLSPDTEPTSGGRPFSCKKRRLGAIPKAIGTGYSKAGLNTPFRQM